MVSDVQKEQSNVLCSLLIWAGVVLQAMGVLLLAFGTIATVIALTKKAAGFDWAIFSLGGSILSANVGLACSLLAYRKHPRKDLSATIQLPACAESGFRRSTPVISAMSKSVQSQTASTRFSEFPNQPPTQLKIIR
jgi:hypothetical protein